MTAPLTPPDCDLQDFPFMPLHVARLRDSDLAGEEKPEACWYAVLLWAASWHQLPAGSLPNNDAVLTKLIGLGRDVKTFARHKAGALRGFVLCDDGRLYHPVVAEQVNSAWAEKLAYRDRKGKRVEAARAAAQARWGGAEHPQDEDAEAMRCASETDAQRMPDALPKGTGTGTGRGILTEDKSSASDDVQVDHDATAWKAVVVLLATQGGMTEPNARRFFGRLLAEHKLQARDLLASATSATVNGTRDPRAYLTKAAAAVATRRHEAAEPKRVDWV